MPHFFIQSLDIENDKIKILKGENYTHLKSALRVRIGEKVLFIDEKYIQYETVVEQIDNQSIVVKIIDKYPSQRFAKLNLYLAQGILKTDAQNYVIQKATELGVKGIYPLITDNCVIKKKVAEQKISHWQKIAYEACKQCERPDIPTIFAPQDFNFITNNDFDYVIAFVERQATMSLSETFKQLNIKENSKILMIIGPEGGFSQREFDLISCSNIPQVTLGNLILRADTAVIAALASSLILFS